MSFEIVLEYEIENTSRTSMTSASSLSAVPS